MTIPHCDGFAIYVELNRTTKTTTFVSLTVAHVAPRKNDLSDDTGWKRNFGVGVGCRSKHHDPRFPLKFRWLNYSAMVTPEPPISDGTSFILGNPSFMCKTVS